MRIAPAVLALLAGLFLSNFSLPAAASAGAGAQCTPWTSRTTPPPTIKVYRISEGFVEKVDFKTYVIRVVSREWNVDQTQLRHAGAHAVKQFAWYHVLHYRGGTYNGKCYDIRDSTADQLYAAKSVSQIPDHVKQSVNHTWSWRLYRDGKFIMTGYRRGEDNPCASDGGYRLSVRSARKCANKGWSAERILKTYYTANLAK